MTADPSDDDRHVVQPRVTRGTTVSRTLPILALVTTIAFTIKQVASAGSAVVEFVRQLIQH